MLSICSLLDYVLVEKVPFKNTSLRGMAVLPSNDSEKDIILLNSSRIKTEQISIVVMRLYIYHYIEMRKFHSLIALRLYRKIKIFFLSGKQMRGPQNYSFHIGFCCQ